MHNIQQCYATLNWMLNFIGLEMDLIHFFLLSLHFLWIKIGKAQYIGNVALLKWQLETSNWFPKMDSLNWKIEIQKILNKCCTWTIWWTFYSSKNP